VKYDRIYRRLIGSGDYNHFIVDCGYIERNGHMNRTPVKSSHILSVGHASGMLEVEYANGTVYQYRGVPEDDYAAMMAGESVGKGLKSIINKDGVVSQRLDPEIILLDE